MSTRKDKRYDTSYKKKENPTQDPYAMLKAPKGPAICRKCLAIYAGTTRNDRSHGMRPLCRS